METVGTSTKIKCLVEMALRGEMTWFTLDSLINGLSQNLESSRQINRILLKEFENINLYAQLKNQMMSMTSQRMSLRLMKIHLLLVKPK